MGWPLRASFERTDRMLVFMGPVSLVAGCQHMLSFAPTASLVGSGEKLGTDLWFSQPTCCGLCQEPFFSGAVALLNYVGDWETLLYVDHVRYVWSWTIRGSSVRSVWRVGRVFPCRVYINLDRHDSWI
jgi:hypothetical protein